MRLVIQNHYDDTEHVIEGSEEELERRLLDEYPWLEAAHEVGDLQGLIDDLDSTQMVSIAIMDESAFLEPESPPSMGGGVPSVTKHAVSTKACPDCGQQLDRCGACEAPWGPIARGGLAKAEVEGESGNLQKGGIAGMPTPHRTYTEAAQAHPQTGSGGPRNLWVRDSQEPSNGNRNLLIQFSSGLLQSGGERGEVDAYYDKLYARREGYHRPDDFWEVPQWIPHVANSLSNTDVYVVRDPKEAMDFIRRAGYKNVAFSVLDVNKNLVRDIARAVPTQNFIVGGYVDFKPHFDDIPNVRHHESVGDWVRAEGQQYIPGYDYRHFRGSKTIPRLTLSDGCRHHCSFCAVPKRLTEMPKDEIMAQADAIAKDLPASLIYLNDKTFGQAPNHVLLPEIYQRIKARNSKFQGFVVQTTAATMKRLTPEFLRAAGIRYVEIGVESFNDSILRPLRKPANEALIEDAAHRLRLAGVSMIPNIMIGLPGETKATYGRTLDWMRRHQDIISHANVYNLALYQQSDLGRKLGTIAEIDQDENQVGKSFHTNPQDHIDFHRDVHRLASGFLDKTPYAPQSAGSGISIGAANPMAKSEQEAIAWEPHSGHRMGAFPGSNDPTLRVSKVQFAHIGQIRGTETGYDEDKVDRLIDQFRNDASEIPSVICEFGEEAPDGSDILYLRDGHHRIEAARRLGITEIPVRTVLEDPDVPSSLLKLIRSPLKQSEGSDREDRLSKTIGYVTFPRLGVTRIHHEPRVVASPRELQTTDDLIQGRATVDYDPHTQRTAPSTAWADRFFAGQGQHYGISAARVRRSGPQAPYRSKHIAAIKEGPGMKVAALRGHEAQHSVFEDIAVRYGDSIRHEIARRLLASLPEKFQRNAHILAGTAGYRESDPFHEHFYEEAIAAHQSFLMSPERRKETYQYALLTKPEAQRRFQTEVKQAWRHLMRRAREIGLIKSEGVSKQGTMVEDLHGFNPIFSDCFRAAKFLAGGRLVPGLDKLRQALWEYDGDPECAALWAYGIEPTEEHIEALRAVVSMEEVAKKEEDSFRPPREIVAGHPSAQGTAEEVSRAIKAGAMRPVKLSGKHSVGSMVVRDPTTGNDYLLKPGSGLQSPASGAQDDPASQSRREAAFYAVAEQLGIEAFFPRADLLVIDGREWAALKLLPYTFQSAQRAMAKESGRVLAALEAYRQAGMLHRWAAVYYLVGETDAHSDNMMIDDHGTIKLIDHGAAFAGDKFNPAFDKNSFVPFCLRAWSSTKRFNLLPAEEKLKQMPTLPADKQEDFTDWVMGIEADQLGALLADWGLDPQPTLARLARLKAEPGSKDVVVNRLWVTT